MTIRTLCIDDDNIVLDVLKEFLTSEGHEIVATTSVQQAMKAIETEIPFTFCISDYQMPEMYGDEFLKFVAQKSPTTIRVLMSGYADTRRIHQATKEGVCRTFVEKPFQLSNLINILNSHLNDSTQHCSTDPTCSSSCE
jgi:two-component system NtrC family sensor kinase